MVDVVCPDCGKKVGVIEQWHGHEIVRHWSYDTRYFKWASPEQKRAMMASHGGHVPPRFRHGTDLIGETYGERPDREIWFECPKHGRFGLTVAALRDAAHDKSKRLPAHRR